MASRWAEQILPRGYRVRITPWHEDAEETIEVYVHCSDVPTFRVRRKGKAVLLTDCIGLTLSFATLADALLAIVPLPKSGKGEMLEGTAPEWLPIFPARQTNEVATLWSRAGKPVLALAKRWAQRCGLEGS